MRTEVEDVVFKRRSTRKYRRQDVPEPFIRRILEAGRFAPSAGNCQPWRFIVVQNHDMIAEMESRVLRILSPLRHVVNAQGFARDVVVSLAGLLGSKNRGDIRPLGAVREILSGRLKVFHDAPALIILLKDTRGIDSPDFDTGLCAQNMVLTAHALKLGTCFIGFTKLLHRHKDWIAKMEIAPPWEIATGICLGYPKFKSDGECQRDTPQIDFYDQQGGRRLLY